MENLGLKPCGHDKFSSLPMIGVCVSGGKGKNRHGTDLDFPLMHANYIPKSKIL